MIDFPTSPAVGTVVTSPNGMSWKWDGTAWIIVASLDVAPVVDTRGYTFFQEAQPTATRVGDTWIQNSTAYSYTWNGTTWFRDPPAPTPAAPVLPDNRSRVQRTNAQAYPGHNVGVTWEAYTYNVGNIATGGQNTTINTPGLYFISYEVQWAGSTVSNVQASWIAVYPGGRREASAQVWPHTSNISGLITGGSSVFRCAAANYFQIQVYAPSSTPPNILTAYMTIVQIAS